MEADVKTKLRGRALVVDDDLEVRSEIKEILEELGYEIIEAKNGEDGLKQLEYIPEIMVILSEVTMPKMGGVEFLRAVRQESDVPFIFLSADESLINLAEAKNLGAATLIRKPVKKDLVVEAVKRVAYDQIASVAMRRYPETDFDYCPILIDEFEANKSCFSDVFLKLSENKYIRVAREGSPLGADRIFKYKRKKVERLYVLKVDFGEYVGIKLQNARAGVNQGISPVEKEKLVRDSLSLLIKDSFENEVNAERLAEARELVQASLGFLLQNNEINSVLNKLKKDSERTFSRFLAVSLYSLAVVRHWGWTSTSNLTKIAMAGLLHDIGRKEIPKEILNRKPRERTTDNKLLMESHTIRGQEILSRIEGLPDEIGLVAIQHHENQKGTGYPYQIEGKRIHPFAKIIGAVDEFCELILPIDEGEKTPQEALSFLWNHRRETMDLHTLKALMEIFNVKVPNEIRDLKQVSFKG